MKKTGYVALGTLIIAIILFISGTMMDGFSELEKLYDKGDLNIRLPFARTMDVTEEFTDIKDLDIQAEAGKVEIIEYSGTTIKVVAKNISTKAKISKEHDTLVIDETFRFWNISNITNISTNIKVYVPNGYEFDKIKFEVDAGEFKVPDLKADNVEIDVDAGSFKAKSIITSYIKVDVDAGDVQIDLLNSYASEFECDAGNIDATMVGSESDYSYKINCDVGDIKIGNYRTTGISDEYSYHGGQRKIEADCDAGSITIKMEV